LKKEATMNPVLLRQLSEYEYLREQLEAEYAEADEDTLRDTIEGLSSLPEALAALGSRIGEMQNRLARIEQRADKKRMTVTAVTERTDIKKLSEPDFTASLRAVPPALLVSDEQQIPQPYWKPQPPKLDKRGLIAALSAGQAIPGASLGNGSTTLSVRTKWWVFPTRSSSCSRASSTRSMSAPGRREATPSPMSRVGT
jgi:hypothetical protein